MSFFVENAKIEIIDISSISPEEYGRYDLTTATITAANCFIEKLFKTVQTPINGLAGIINNIDAKLMIMDITLPQPTKLFIKLTELNDVAVSPVEYYQVAGYNKSPMFLDVYELTLNKIEEP